MKHATRTTTGFLGHCTGPILGAILLAILGQALVSPAAAQELLTNGNFETGTLASWTVTDLGVGTFAADTPGTTSPLSNKQTTAITNSGNFYAVSDQPGEGAHALTQTFTVPGPGSVVLTFDMFVNNHNIDGVAPIVGAQGLNHLPIGTPNQHGRVDILTSDGTAFNTVLCTAALVADCAAGADVLLNLFIGTDAGANPHASTSYSFDLFAALPSSIGRGGTFQIRFAEADNQGFFNVGVDNVSIQFTAGIPTLPEWGFILLSLSLLTIATWRLAGQPVLFGAVVTGEAVLLPDRGRWLSSLLLGQGVATVGLLLYALLVSPLVPHDGLGTFLSGLLIGVMIVCYRRGRSL